MALIIVMDITIDKITTEGEEEEGSIEITIITTVTVLTVIINLKIVLPLMIKDLFLFLDQKVLLGRK